LVVELFSIIFLITFSTYVVLIRFDLARYFGFRNTRGLEGHHRSK